MSAPQPMYRWCYFLAGYQGNIPVYYCVLEEYLGHPGNLNEEYNVNWSQEHQHNLVQIANQLTSQGPSTAGVSAATDGDSFQCKWSTVPCGQAQADLDELMAHLGDIHGVRGPAAKKFVCSWTMEDGRPCSQELRRDGFKRHIATHLAFKVPCTECGKIFSRRDSMNAHGQRKHGW